MAENINMLNQFFIQAADVISPCGGCIHITHKTFEPFCWWDLIGIATNSLLIPNTEGKKRRVFVYDGSILFDRCLYPGYINRKALDNKSFPLFDAQTFVFSLQEKNEAKSIRKSKSLSLSSSSSSTSSVVESVFNQYSHILLPLNRDLIESLEVSLRGVSASVPVQLDQGKIQEGENKKRKR